VHTQLLAQSAMAAFAKNDRLDAILKSLV